VGVTTRIISVNPVPGVGRADLHHLLIQLSN
jgi:hypothetical protein